MPALFTATTFLSAVLLFLVQPLFARQILPLLGGSPAVWNTAMVFFQAILLAGYAYAHLASRRFPPRRHALLHLAVVAAPFAVLPLAVPATWIPPTETSPIPWLLALLAVTVGLPFFALSATSPLLQRWFAASDHPRAANPYSLYAASNVGSLLALLSYPFLLEPYFSLPAQSRLWTAGYALFALLILACALTLRRTSSTSLASTPSRPSAPLAPPAEPLTPVRRLRWALLAFVPTSLMLGVTTYLSSEIAVVPLLWIIPLALYLVTFIVAFAHRPPLSLALLARIFPLLAIILILALAMLLTRPIAAPLPPHLGVFFVAAVLCHLQLAADRPPPANLTEFYLWLSLGSVLGGAANALLAPLLFNSVLEYPLALLLACAVALPSTARFSRHDLLAPFFLGSVVYAALLLLGRTAFATDNRALGLVFGAAVLACYFFSRHPLRFALGLAAILLASHFTPGAEGDTLVAERSFFGVHRVVHDRATDSHALLHGVTTHGRESLDPSRRGHPLTYYHESGPIGDILQARIQRHNSTDTHIAVIGLGAGSLAAYAQPHQRWSFYEIDPVVVRLARDERYFTFLRRPATPPRLIVGDARLSLAAEPDARFDLIVIDAYSSDAIPVHLVTREALALYLRKLAPHGRLAFHISNVHLDLEPVFGNLARDAHLVALTCDDTHIPPEAVARGKAPSTWLVMARTADDLRFSGPPPHLPWRPARTAPHHAVWTDNYSSPLQILRWQ